MCTLFQRHFMRFADFLLAEKAVHNKSAGEAAEVHCWVGSRHESV